MGPSGTPQRNKGLPAEARSLPYQHTILIQKDPHPCPFEILPKAVAASHPLGVARVVMGWPLLLVLLVTLAVFVITVPPANP